MALAIVHSRALNGLEAPAVRVEVQTGETFEAGIPEALFTASLRPITINNRYLVSPDGQRFLLLSSLVEDSTPPTTVVVNWTAELVQR